jgi:hypothetical protein
LIEIRTSRLALRKLGFVVRGTAEKTFLLGRNGATVCICGWYDLIARPSPK